MSFFKNLGAELGTGTGKGVNAIFISFWKIICFYASYLFKIEHKDGEHILHTNSFRIANWSLLLALIFTPGLVTCSFKPSEILSTINKPNTVAIKVALNIQPIPFFPTNERFNIDHNQKIQHYTDINGIRFFAYHRRSGEKFPIITVKEHLCAIVPAGEKIAFDTHLFPVYVVNMKDIVIYDEKMNSISFFKRYTAVFYFLFGSLDKINQTSNTWEYLYNHWESVDTKNNYIFGEALDSKDILDNIAGGIVCF